MLVDIGMALAVAAGLFLVWKIVRFALELRSALVDAASGSWGPRSDTAVSSVAEQEYVREEIVIRNGRATHVTLTVSTHQPLPGESALSTLA